LRWALRACDEIGGTTPSSDPSFEIIEPGRGDTNTALLWPMRVGSIWGVNVAEGTTHRGGLELLRYVQPPVDDPIFSGESNPPVVSWYSQGEAGLAFHGSTRQGFYETPLLLVPAEVRLGMIWQSEIDGVRVRFEVTDRNDEATPLFGMQTVWTVVQTVATSGSEVAEWRWTEGFGPLHPNIRRVFLPEEEQPGIDLIYADSVVGERVDEMSETGVIDGPTQSFRHVSSHTLDTGGRGAAAAHGDTGWGACFSSNGARVFPGDHEEAGSVLINGRCPGFDADRDGQFDVAGHVGLAVPLDGAAYFARGPANGETESIFATETTIKTLYATYLDADGQPETLMHLEGAMSTFSRRHRALRLQVPSGTLNGVVGPASRWVAVDQVTQFMPATSGPRNVIMHGFDPLGGSTPVPMTLRSASGALLSSTFGVDGIGPIELAFHKAGNVHYAMHADRREILITTPDGLVHRAQPSDRGLSLMRIGQVQVPEQESVVGAFWPSDPEADDVPLLVVTAVNDFVCASSRCVRPHHLYSAAVALPAATEDSPPPSTGVSAVRDGWDVLVCWPRALGDPSASTGWQIGGRAPAAVVEEPDGVGSCALVMRDLSTPPEAAPGAFYVQGMVPGVGPIHMAVAVESDGSPVPDLDSFSDVLERPGLAVSYPPSPYATTGGFISMSMIFGATGVPVSAPENLDSIEGGVSVVGTPGADFVGLWSSYSNLLHTYVTLSGGPGSPSFELEPGLVQVTSARPGMLMCITEPTTSERRCVRLMADGTMEDAGDLHRSSDLIAGLELADGTVCGQDRCIDPDGTEHMLATTSPGSAQLPLGRGWFEINAGVPGIRYVDVDAGTAAEVDARCGGAPSRDLDGQWWTVLRDDGMGGCAGPDSDLTLSVARLRVDGIDEVTALPQPRDVYDDQHTLAGVVVGREVVLVLTAGSSRGAGGGGRGTRVRDIYRVPRSMFP